MAQFHPIDLTYSSSLPPEETAKEVHRALCQFSKKQIEVDGVSIVTAAEGPPLSKSDVEIRESRPSEFWSRYWDLYENRALIGGKGISTYFQGMSSYPYLSIGTSPSLKGAFVTVSCNFDFKARSRNRIVNLVNAIIEQCPHVEAASKSMFTKNTAPPEEKTGYRVACLGVLLGWICLIAVVTLVISCLIFIVSS